MQWENGTLCTYSIWMNKTLHIPQTSLCKTKAFDNRHQRPLCMPMTIILMGMWKLVSQIILGSPEDSWETAF